MYVKFLYIIVFMRQRNGNMPQIFSILNKHVHSKPSLAWVRGEREKNLLLVGMCTGSLRSSVVLGGLSLLSVCISTVLSSVLLPQSLSLLPFLVPHGCLSSIPIRMCEQDKRGCLLQGAVAPRECISIVSLFLNTNKYANHRCL